MSRKKKAAQAPEPRAYVIHAMGEGGAIIKVTLEGSTHADRERWAKLFAAAPALRAACEDAHRTLSAFGTVLSDQSGRLKKVLANARGAA